MITIKDELYITKEVNSVLCMYTNKIILKELLQIFSFGINKKSSVISSLMKEINSCENHHPKSGYKI